MLFVCSALSSCLLDAGHVGIGSDSAQMGVGPTENRKVEALTQFGEYLKRLFAGCSLTVVCREAKTLTVRAGSWFQKGRTIWSQASVIKAENN